MQANEYQKEALRTASGMTLMDIPIVLGNPMVLNGVMGLVGEAGECADLVKKTLFQRHPLDKEHLAKELGDVAWYLAVAAHGLGYDLDTIFRMNVQKLRKRYPDGFDPDRSLHRKAGDI